MVRTIHIVLTHYTFLYSFMKIYVTVTELWCVQYFYNNQRDNTHKLRKGEQPFLYATHRLDLILNPIRLHEDTPNSY